MPQLTTPSPRVARRGRRCLSPAESQVFRDDARFGYRCGTYDLVLPADPKLLRAASRGEAEFALFVEEPVVLLGFRFGESGAWSAARFCWQDRPRQDQTPPLDSNDRALVSIRSDGSGDAWPSRNLTLSLDFTRALNDCVRELARGLDDPRAEARALATLRRRYPNVKAMLPRALARSVGMP
jgi:hypothetical protein